MITMVDVNEINHGSEIGSWRCSECKRMVLVAGQGTDRPLPFCGSPLTKRGPNAIGFLGWDSASCEHFVLKPGLCSEKGKEPHLNANKIPSRVERKVIYERIS
jgi:hypothetical protein